MSLPLDFADRRSFEALEVGPFPAFLGAPGIKFAGKTVKGRDVDYDMDLRLAKSQLGGIGFELIQPPCCSGP